MKKAFFCVVSILLFLFFALSAIATETELSGIYRIRAYTEYNFDKKVSDITEEQFDGWFEQRFRLTITHTRNEYLKAVVSIDLVEDTWGQGRAMRINDSRRSFIDWAYLEFNLPKMGNFKIGKFPVSWGHGLTFSKTYPGVDGVEWQKSWGPVTTTILYRKVTDRATSSLPYDEDFIGLHIAYAPSEDHLMELFGGYNHHYYKYNNAKMRFEFGLVGLAYTGKINDMFDIKMEGGIIFGSYRTRIISLATNIPGLTYGEIFGWNFFCDVSYKNDKLKVGMAFLMLSGTDDPAVFNISAITDTFHWANIIGCDREDTVDLHRLVCTKENITSVKLYLELYPTERLTLNFALIWAQFTEPVGPGNLWYNYLHPAERGNWGSYPFGGYGVAKSRDLGWEVDFGFSYEIIEGLTFTFAGGVLFTGDAWDYDADGVAGPPYVRKNWGPIYSIVNELKFEF